MVAGHALLNPGELSLFRNPLGRVCDYWWGGNGADAVDLNSVDGLGVRDCVLAGLCFR